EAKLGVMAVERRTMTVKALKNNTLYRTACRMTLLRTDSPCLSGKKICYRVGIPGIVTRFTNTHHTLQLFFMDFSPWRFAWRQPHQRRIPCGSICFSFPRPLCEYAQER